MDEITRRTVELVAKVVGNQSAAQQALDDADRREKAGQSVRFYQSGSTILVKGESKEA